MTVATPSSARASTSTESYPTPKRATTPRRRLGGRLDRAHLKREQNQRVIVFEPGRGNHVSFRIRRSPPRCADRKPTASGRSPGNAGLPSGLRKSALNATRNFVTDFVLLGDLHRLVQRIAQADQAAKRFNWMASRLSSRPQPGASESVMVPSSGQRFAIEHVSEHRRDLVALWGW